MKKPSHIVSFICFVVFLIVSTMIMFPQVYKDFLYKPKDEPKAEAPAPEEPKDEPETVEKELLFSEELNSDGGYTVLGIGTHEGDLLYIPSYYGGYPVTAIAPKAFMNCPGINRVIISGGVKTIGEKAFFGCADVKLVEFLSPEDDTGLKNIEQYTFANCSSLESVNIPDSVEYIGQHAFSGCKKLQSVTLPEAIKQIDKAAFRNCSSITEILIPACENEETRSPVHTKIADFTFEGCSSLVSVSIPATLEEIGESAFDGCFALTTLKLTDEVSALDAQEVVDLLNVTTLGERAFAGCGSVTTVKSDLVHKLPKAVFEGCEKLAVIDFALIEEISDFAFADCAALDNIAICGVDTVGKSAFSNCTSLTNLTLEDIRVIDDSAFLGCTSLASLVLPETLETIGTLAFSETAVTEIVIPEEVKQISSQAFKDCKAAATLVINHSDFSVDPTAFVGCLGFTKVKTPIGFFGGIHPSKITELEIYGTDDDVFGRTEANKLSSLVKLDVKLGALDYEALASHETLEAVKLDVLNVGDRSFAGCANLGSLTVSGRVEKIGVDAFAACSALALTGLEDGGEYLGYELNDGDFVPTVLVSVSDSAQSCEFILPETLLAVYHSAFKDNENLESVKVSSSLKMIGKEAFAGCTSLVELEIAGGSELKYVFDYAFDGCNNLESAIDFGEELASIGDYAFNECGKISAVNFAANSNLRAIGDHAFAQCDALTSVYLPEGVLSIGDKAFYACSNLESVLVPVSVISKGVDLGSVFVSCVKLNKIYLKSGMEIDLDAIGLDDSEFENKIYYYSETAPEAEGRFWYFNGTLVEEYPPRTVA